MYRNFICYRGGSSAGIPLAELIYKHVDKVKHIVGKTYYSLSHDDKSEIRNFLNDPEAIMKDVENFIMIITKDFYEGFILDGKANPDSVTRVEIEEALKNQRMKFIPIIFSDFSYDDKVDGMKNKDILSFLYGEEGAKRIIGAPPIMFYHQHKNSVIDLVIDEIDVTGKAKEFEKLQFDGTFKLEPTPSVITKPVFCGRDDVLDEIKNLFDNGERIVFLQGIGGIGKTEIAKQYAKRNKDKYDTIIYVTYSTTIVELFSSQASFKIEPYFPRHVLSDGTQESDLSFFNRKLNLIKEITNERTLIVMDNFDVMDDEHFKDILDANYKLLITTRCDYSRLYPTIKIEPLASIEQLKKVFLENYQGYMVNEDDPHLEELIELVNRHTYTIELIAQHMENSGQTVEEMIETLKNEGIISLNEEVRSSRDSSAIAYENLLKMFKVFNLDEEEKKVLQYLSLMPLNGVDVKDLRDWLGLKSFKVVKGLENRSWLVVNSNGIALHPIIRDVVRFELPLNAKDAATFLEALNETIKEEKSWHFSIVKKGYYADIASEIISIFNEINPDTLQLYINVELLFSFSIKPIKAVELGKRLYDYFVKTEGENSFNAGYASFQTGWTYLFNLHLPNALKDAKIWLEKSYIVLSKLTFTKEHEYAVYGHCLTHLSRIYLIAYQENKDQENLDKAIAYSEQAVDNAINHFSSQSQFYSRIAVAYMQLADAYIAIEQYDKALKLVDDAYNIMYSLFGEDDPDALNVSSSKSNILYNLARYDEALSIGQKNLVTYTSFYGELNFLRFEQLMIILKCYIKLGNEEQVSKLKIEALRIGEQLLAEDSKQLQELKNI